MKDRASGVYWKTVDLVWSGCVHRAGRGLRRCDRERGHSRFPPCHPSCPDCPARVQGPGGQAQAPQSYATPWVGGRPRRHLSSLGANVGPSLPAVPDSSGGSLPVVSDLGKHAAV